MVDVEAEVQDQNLKRKDPPNGTVDDLTTNPQSKKADVEMSFVAEKQNDLESEADKIRNGTHPELVKKLAELTSIRQSELDKATQRYELQMSEAQALLDFEKKAAEDSYQCAVADFKERLLSEVKESMRNLEALQRGDVEDQVRVSTRKLRSKAKLSGSDSLMELEQEKSTSAPTTRKTKGDTMNLKFAVEEPDILQDMNKIYSEWRSLAEKKLNKKSLNEELVRFESGRLVVNDQILEKGDYVQVKNNITDEEYYGKVSAVHPDQIIVKVADNSKSHILLRDMRNGRCSIMRDMDDA